MSIVAGIQFTSVDDVRENVKHALALCTEAACKGAQIIVLSELCTCSATLQSRIDAAAACQTVDGWQTERFAKLSLKTGATIVFGYCELAEGVFHNSACAVHRGDIVCNVRKHNLEGNDTLWAVPGEEELFPVIITEVGRLGVLIGDDVLNNHTQSYRHFKHNERYYRQGSVDVIALCAATKSDYVYPDMRWIELARSTQSNVIVANRVGADKDLTFKGGSAIIDRRGGAQTYGSNFESDAVVGANV